MLVANVLMGTQRLLSTSSTGCLGIFNHALNFTFMLVFVGEVELRCNVSNHFSNINGLAINHIDGAVRAKARLLI